MFVATTHPTHHEVSIQLASGLIAGTGFAQERSTAEYFACKDAIASGFLEAACGHSQYLSERDEASIRSQAQAAKTEGAA